MRAPHGRAPKRSRMSLFPTEAAQRALRTAQAFATARGELATGPESLLAGTLADDSQRAARVVRGVGVSREQLLRALHFSPEKLPEEHWYCLPTLAPASREILRCAQLEARHLGVTTFGTDHLLLALSASPTAAGEHLIAAGATPEVVRGELTRLAVLASHEPGSAARSSDSPPGPPPQEVVTAVTVLMLQLLCGCLSTWQLLGARQPSEHDAALFLLPILWNVILCPVLCLALQRGKGWAWNSAVLWLGVNCCLAVGSIPYLFAASPSAASVLSPFLGLQAAVLTWALAGLVVRRDWFYAHRQNQWRLLLRQGAVVLTLTVLLDLLPLAVPAVERFSTILRGQP